MSLADLRALPHFSVSQLRAFLSCPRRFFFQYIERAEPAFRPIALAFGTAWHTVIGHHLSHSTYEAPVSREELRDLLRQSLEAEVMKDGIPVLFDTEDANLGTSIDLGIRMLDVFLDKVLFPEEVLGVEVPFVLELAHPVTGEIASLPLIGAIDAIVMENGAPGVWELKTGAKKWSADQLEYDAQMTAYAMAARELGHNDPELKLLVTTKTKTPDVQVERLVRHRADKQELAETALTVLHAVTAGIDYRVRGWGCKTCAHAGVCGV
jgi:RecB family exonuclease